MSYNYSVKIDNDILEFAKKHKITLEDLKSLIKPQDIISSIEQHNIDTSSIPTEWGIYADNNEYECIVSIKKENDKYIVELVDIYITHEEDDEEAQKIVDSIIKE